MTAPPIALKSSTDHSARLEGRRIQSFLWEANPEFNEGLRVALLKEEPEILGRLTDEYAVQGAARSTTAGYRDYNVLTWNYPECRQLQAIIAAAYRSFCEHYSLSPEPAYIQCWCNIMHAGQKLGLHNHWEDGGCTAGVYYPGTVSPGEGGHTYYGIARDREEWLKVSPVTGMMNVFQGDLKHFVTTYEGRAPRLSIAFDILPEPRAGQRYIPLFRR